MRIGVDLFSIVPATGRGGGFHRYTTELISALRDVGTADHYFLFTNSLNSSMFPRDRGMTQVVVPLPPQRQVWPFRLAWQHGLLPVLARRYKLDLMHFPTDTAALWPGVPYVVTTNDVIMDVYYPMHHTESVSSLKARYLFAAKRRAAQRADRVICPSQATAAEVTRHYDVPPSSITVIWDGVDHNAFQAESSEPRQPPYVLSVLSLSPHKNVETLIAAFAAARDRYTLPHELHLIGMPGTDASPVTTAINRAVAAGVPIRHLGYVEDEVLATAYREASLFVFLSRVEGFGLPPLEAMASGTPVIASNVSSMPEVCGDAALLVSPDDVQEAAEAIGRLLTQPDKASRLRTAGLERARLFSWAETARLTHDVYERVLAGNRTRGR